MTTRWGWTAVVCLGACAALPHVWSSGVEPRPGESRLDLASDVSAWARSDREVLLALVDAAREFPASAGDANPRWPSAAAAKLRRAADEGAGLALAEYLRAAAGQIEGAPGPPLDPLAYRTLDTPAFALIGPGAAGDSPWQRVRAIAVGVRDADDERWVRAYLSSIREFERSLPLPAEFQPGDEPWRAPFVVADLAMRGGTAARSTSPSTTLPLDRTSSPDAPRGWVFWRNAMRDGWYAAEIEPTARLVLADDLRSLATARAHLCFYATRFSTYALGPQRAPAASGAVPLDERFGELHNPLVIAKADLLGVLGQLWLVARGVQPHELSREMLAMLVVMAFRAMQDARAGNAPAPHEPASALELGWAIDHEALSVGDDDRWRFDESKLTEAIRSLAGEILRIHARGDVDGARALLERYARPRDEVRRTLERIGTVPKPSCVPFFRVTGL
jgi:hypothetical protein